MPDTKKYIDFAGLSYYDSKLKTWVTDLVNSHTPSVDAIQSIKAGQTELPVEEGTVTLSSVAGTGSYDDLKDKPFGTDVTSRDFCSFTALISDSNNPRIENLTSDEFYTGGFYNWSQLVLDSTQTIHDTPVYKSEGSSDSKDYNGILFSRNLENLTYEVEYDGVSYRGKPYLINTYNETQYYGLGCLPVSGGEPFTPEDAETASEQESFPFFVEIVRTFPHPEEPNHYQNCYDVNFYIVNDETDHTLSLKTVEEEIKKIDKKYLPNMVETIPNGDILNLFDKDIEIVEYDLAGRGPRTSGTLNALTTGIILVKVSDLDKDGEPVETKMGEVDLLTPKFTYGEFATDEYGNYEKEYDSESNSNHYVIADGTDEVVDGALTEVSGSINNDENNTIDVRFNLFGIPVAESKMGIGWYK